MPRPLNFLHMTTFYPPYSFGGDAMYVRRLCHALADRGHHCDVVHCLDAYRLLHPAEPQVEFASHPRVTVHSLHSQFGRLSPLLTQQTGRPLLKHKQISEVLNLKKYDVIHYHNMSLLGPTVMELEPQRGAAVKLYTTHEHWLICPTHVLWKYDEKPCEKADCLKCTVMHRRPPQIWRYTGLLKRASRHVDQFLAPSRFTAQIHAERGFLRSLDHLPLFMDCVEGEESGPRPHDRPYFLFVGRLEKIKGLQTLLAVWDQVPDADFLVAGTGSYEPVLRSMAADNPRVRFLGLQSQQDLKTLYQHALACIVPSITYETFGLICIEAFARKTPVIVRDIGGLAEMVDDSQGGLIYRTDNELLNAVHQISVSRDLRDKLGQNGYDAYVRNWSTSPHVERYFNFVNRAALRKFGHLPWDDDPLQAQQTCVIASQEDTCR